MPNFNDGDQMENATERTLTVLNYGDGADKNGKRTRTRVSLAPHRVLFTIASEDTYDMADGVELKKVNVIFDEGANLELYITLLDLISIERATSTYFLP